MSKPTFHGVGVAARTAWITHDACTTGDTNRLPITNDEPRLNETRYTQPFPTSVFDHEKIKKFNEKPEGKNEYRENTESSSSSLFFLCGLLC